MFVAQPKQRPARLVMNKGLAQSDALVFFLRIAVRHQSHRDRPQPEDSGLRHFSGAPHARLPEWEIKNGAEIAR